MGPAWDLSAVRTQVKIDCFSGLDTFHPPEVCGGGAGLRVTALDLVKGPGQQDSEATLIKGAILVCLTWAPADVLAWGWEEKPRLPQKVWKCEPGDLCTEMVGPGHLQKPMQALARDPGDDNRMSGEAST